MKVRHEKRQCGRLNIWSLTIWPGWRAYGHGCWQKNGISWWFRIRKRYTVGDCSVFVYGPVDNCQSSSSYTQACRIGDKMPGRYSVLRSDIWNASPITKDIYDLFLSQKSCLVSLVDRCGRCYNCLLWWSWHEIQVLKQKVKENKLRRESDSASNEGSMTLHITIILIPSCFEKILYHCYSPEIGTPTCAVKGDCKVHLDEKRTKSIKIIPC